MIYILYCISAKEYILYISFLIYTIIATSLYNIIHMNVNVHDMHACVNVISYTRIYIIHA